MGAGLAAAADAALGLTNTIISGSSAYNARKEFWQKSGSAHQREVADLTAAGINPVLTGGGPGAASSMGPTAESNIPGRALEAYQAKTKLGIDRQLADENIKLIRANTAATEAQARRTSAEEEMIRLNVLNNPDTLEQIRASAAASRARAGIDNLDARKKRALAPAWDAAGAGINTILQSYPGLIDWVARKIVEFQRLNSKFNQGLDAIKPPVIRKPHPEFRFDRTPPEQ